MQCRRRLPRSLTPSLASPPFTVLARNVPNKARYNLSVHTRRQAELLFARRTSSWRRRVSSVRITRAPRAPEIFMKRLYLSIATEVHEWICFSDRRDAPAIECVRLSIRNFEKDILLSRQALGEINATGGVKDVFNIHLKLMYFSSIRALQDLRRDLWSSLALL